MNSNVVVITGALGALGRVVATNAVAAGATVVAIDVVDGTPVDGVSELVTVDLGDAEATAQALAGIAADPAVKVVVIAGAGRAFCVGHDLREVQAEAKAIVDAALEG